MTADGPARQLAEDRARALRLTPVSHETLTRLDRFVETLLKWQRAVQLVAPSSLPALWTRHVSDSLQLLAVAPDAKRWADLGSGGGFPGLVIAIARAGEPGFEMHLVESDSRKAAFLREAARAVGVSIAVHNERVEAAAGRLAGRLDIVTARALAPMPRLLALAEPFLAAGAKGIFLKGQDVDNELTEAAKSWTVRLEQRPSLTDSKARIVLVDRIAAVR